MELRKAQKSKSKLRIGLAGTSGSGKTYSALLLASGLTSWDKICVIDTENGSADLYANLGEYNVLTLPSPFTPEKYISAIKTAEEGGMEVIIIDSITHEWSGVGGILEAQEQLGGRYQDWGKVKPRHRKFIDALLQSNCHIITTVRSKQDYAMDQIDGKTKITKMGTKQVTEEGFEYEMTLTFDVLQNHLAKASKDRTGLFVDKPESIITKETGTILKEWSETGIDIVEDIPKVIMDNDYFKMYMKVIDEVGSKEALKDLHQEIKTKYRVDDNSKILVEGIIRRGEQLDKNI